MQANLTVVRVLEAIESAVLSSGDPGSGELGRLAMRGPAPPRSSIPGGLEAAAAAAAASIAAHDSGPHLRLAGCPVTATLVSMNHVLHRCTAPVPPVGAWPCLIASASSNILSHYLYLTVLPPPLHVLPPPVPPPGAWLYLIAAGSSDILFQYKRAAEYYGNTACQVGGWGRVAGRQAGIPSGTGGSCLCAATPTPPFAAGPAGALLLLPRLPAAR